MQSGDQLASASDRGFADDVAVELVMLAQPAALRPLVAKHLRHAKPLHRLAKIAMRGRDHARERRRHLRSQGDRAAAFVGEIVELFHDLLARLVLEELEIFEERPVVLDKAIAPRNFAPLRKDVIPNRAVVRQEIAKAGKRLHQSERHSGATHAADSGAALRKEGVR